jgi:ribosomal protein L11 methyltransferase
MYLWRRSASPRWLDANEDELRALARGRLTIVERANRERLQLEVAGKSRAQLEKLARQFGGRVEKLPRDWLKRALRRKTKPLRIGHRRLIIPAGAAFGTGDHATTAMCLRLLEKSVGEWESDWSLLDIGTGSGVLALAAKLLGATRVIGIDNDPIAISTAKRNARLNKIRSVRFEVGDVRRLKIPRTVDVVTANLFSELLIELVPKLKTACWLILSGILREQERDVRRSLTRNKIDIIDARRRGKWVAMLARCR